jgi:Xaa-Pro aminopeptidase
MYDCVCILTVTDGGVAAQLYVPSCSPAKDAFDGCAVRQFEGSIVHTIMPTSCDVPTFTLNESPWPAKAMRTSRTVKTEEEQQRLRRACRDTCRALRATLRRIRRGRRRLSEHSVAQTFQYHCSRLGRRDMSFPPIVATGAHAARLHHSPDTHTMVDGAGTLVLDVGARCEGYCADVTVSLVPKGSKSWIRIYAAVLKAVDALVAYVPSCRTWDDISNQSRTLMLAALKECDLVHPGATEEVVIKFMPHSCGHHLGLDTHDWCDNQIVPGAVLAIELGIYLPENSTWTGPADTARIAEAGPGGVRIEDNVLVTETGVENLTRPHLNREARHIIMDTLG